MTDPSPSYNIAMVVAYAQNLAIGKDNNLLWHISDDLKHFKALTSGHTVIMGRKTFESLPKRPLPNRRNIVLTNNKDFCEPGVDVAHSVASVFSLLNPDEEAFVIGGASIYATFMPFAKTIYATHVYQDFDADAFFPPIDRSVFRLVSSSEHFHDEKNGIEYSFTEYHRFKNDSPREY